MISRAILGKASRGIVSRSLRFNSSLNLVKPNVSNVEAIQGEANVPPAETNSKQSGDLSESSNEIPWYLRDDSASPLIEVKEIDLPSVPENAPASLNVLLNLLAYDYGLSDIALFDLTSLPESHHYSSKNQLVNYVILATGKSEKHIYKAASELRHYIKHHYDILPVLEGMVSASVSPAARRRLLRRARKGPPATDNDYGKNPNSWVMCNTLVDDIHVHMLTKERREELLLETVYCAEEDLPKYQRAEDSSFDSDDIFIGIKRSFHTSSKFRAYSTSTEQSLLSIYENALNQAELDDKFAKVYKDDFDSTFAKLVQPSLQNYKVQFNFYKALHFTGLVTFEELEQVLLGKYLDLGVVLKTPQEELTKTISTDIVEYAKLLIDSPELRALIEPEKIGEHSDNLLDRLSGFISKSVRFSSEEIDLLSDPDFVPLLWRLSFSENQSFIGSQLINDIIYNDAEIPSGWSQKLINLASNRARDVSDLIKYHNKRNNRVPTLAYRELILQTYGNAGKWEQFWREWNNSFNTLQNQALDSRSLVSNWVRLAVYLAARNDKASIIKFFYGYWSRSSAGRTFIDDFKSNQSSFNSPEEKIAFKHAIMKMLHTVQEGDSEGSFTYVKSFADKL